MTAFVLIEISSVSGAESRAPLDVARKMMVKEEIVGAGISHPGVIRSMSETLRHEFVSFRYRAQAYFDMSLPIGAKQTISSPFIVAFMTESIDPQKEDRVLEIGTGSGYQAAVLSGLVREVYTIEIVESLGRKATRTLRRLGYENVHVKIGDGYQGWAEHAPFDKIIVTCSPENIPQPLVDQLKEDGVMVIPVGQRYQQTLFLLTKKQGKLTTQTLRPTLFVPMTGLAESERKVKPDPGRPVVVNGNFEAPMGDEPSLPGWYYQRQVRWEIDPEAPQGDHFATFYNKTAGRGSRALQGFPLDGRLVETLRLSAWVKTDSVVTGSTPDMMPAVAISVYDENRRDVGRWWLGPWRGTSDWHEVSESFRIPRSAREGILRIGLFGATGEVSFDNIQMEAVER